MMRESRPFIPRDKPKLWVIGVLSGLTGLGLGLLAFIAAFNELAFIKHIFIGGLMLCWLSFAVSWLALFARSHQGIYSKIEAKPWKDQLW